MTTPLLIDPNDRPDEVWADPVRGRFRWRTLLSSDVTASDTFTAGIMSLEAGEHWAVHRHAEAELYFGLTGEADVEVDGKIYRLKPETLIYIPGNVFHGIPTTSASLRLFYTFASDSFDAIKYTFQDER